MKYLVKQIEYDLASKGIEEESAGYAANLVEFLHRTGKGRAGRRVSQILLEGDLFHFDSRKRPYVFGQGLEGKSSVISADDAYKIADNICIGLEVLLHFGFVLSDNSVRYSISAKGVDYVDKIADSIKR